MLRASGAARGRRRPATALLVLALAGGLPPAALAADEPESAPPPAVAVVVDSSGENLRIPPGGEEAEAVGRFDWIAAGTGIRLAADGGLTIAFADGRRFRLGPGASVVVGEAGLEDATGPVEELDPVPALPPLAAASTGSELARPAALRLRGVRIGGLEPDASSTALAGATTLRYDPPREGGRYRVEIENEEGDVVFELETGSAEIPVPAGVLEPDRTYWWSVETVDRTAGVGARGWARFETLPAEDARAWEELAAALGAAPSRPDLALLAEVDCRLGLLARCRASLERLLADAGAEEAVALEARLAEVRAALEGG